MAHVRLVRWCAAGVGMLSLGFALRPAAAQSLDSLRRRFQIPLPISVEVAATASRIAPGSSAGSQSAYGPNFGDGFFGVGAQQPPSGSRLDGSAVAGFGLLNARDYVGIEISVTSLSTVNEGFGQRGAFGFKVHRALPRSAAIAVGGENLAGWGGTDSPHTFYAVGSKVFRLREREGDPFGTITANLGVGNGRFRNDAVIPTPSNGSKVGGFGSLGIRVHEAVSVIADWPGQQLTLGASIVPVRFVPLVISPAFVDVTHRLSNNTRFQIGVGLGFKFTQIRNIFMPPEGGR